MLTPVVFSLRNLDSIASSMPLERFAALSGAALFASLLYPEQDPPVREMVESKPSSQTGILLTRLLLAAAALLLMEGALVLAMRMGGCTFPLGSFWMGGFVSALCLGALGFAAYIVTENLPAAYLIPLGFYLVNLMLGSQKLGYFYLFSLSEDHYTPKLVLAAVSLLLLAGGLVYREIKRRVR